MQVAVAADGLPARRRRRRPAGAAHRRARNHAAGRAGRRRRRAWRARGCCRACVARQVRVVLFARARLVRRMWQAHVCTGEAAALLAVARLSPTGALRLLPCPRCPPGHMASACACSLKAHLPAVDEQEEARDLRS